MPRQSNGCALAFLVVSIALAGIAGVAILGCAGLMYIGANSQLREPELVTAAPNTNDLPKEPPKAVGPIKVEQSPEPTREDRVEPIERFSVEARSMIVKKVDGAHRYFFQIRNKDTRPFSGEVTIKLFSDRNRRVEEEETSFTTKEPIEPDLGTVVFIDTSKPPSVFNGDRGIWAYDFVVKVGGKEVATGWSEVSSKFENLDE